MEKILHQLALSYSQHRNGHPKWFRIFSINWSNRTSSHSKRVKTLSKSRGRAMFVSAGNICKPFEVCTIGVPIKQELIQCSSREWLKLKHIRNFPQTTCLPGHQNFWFQIDWIQNSNCDTCGCLHALQIPSRWRLHIDGLSQQVVRNVGLGW